MTDKHREGPAGSSIRPGTKTDQERATRDDKRASDQRARSERFELLEHVQSMLEPVMAALGLGFLILLLVDFALTDVSPQNRARIDGALRIIWVVFVMDFAIRLIIAPAKLSFLRQNWLAVLSLGIPFLRPLRVFQAARALRSLSLVRFLGGINRGIRVLQTVTRGRQFMYIGGLTVLAVFAGAIGALYFDRGTEDAPIQSFGDALWWSAAMMTTINNEKYAVSVEARVIAILLRVFAVSVFGFITASIATYLIGSAGIPEARAEEETKLHEEISALRHELGEIRVTLSAHHDDERLRRVDDERRPTPTR